MLPRAAGDRAAATGAVGWIDLTVPPLYNPRIDVSRAPRPVPRPPAAPPHAVRDVVCGVIRVRRPTGAHRAVAVKRGAV